MEFIPGAHHHMGEIINQNTTIRSAVRRKYPAVAIDESLAAAMKIMSEANSSALVVKVGEELVGVVTIADIMHCLTTDNDFKETKISSFMTKCEFISPKGTRNPCAQLDENEDVMSAIKVMYEAGVNHLLVSGSKGEPVGMVSSLDIIKLLAS